jgi:hypothetical protein
MLVLFFFFFCPTGSIDNKQSTATTNRNEINRSGNGGVSLYLIGESHDELLFLSPFSPTHFHSITFEATIKTEIESGRILFHHPLGAHDSV